MTSAGRPRLAAGSRGGTDPLSFSAVSSMRYAHANSPSSERTPLPSHSVDQSAPRAASPATRTAERAIPAPTPAYGIHESPGRPAYREPFEHYRGGEHDREGARHAPREAQHHESRHRRRETHRSRGQGAQRKRAEKPGAAAARHSCPHRSEGAEEVPEKIGGCDEAALGWRQAKLRGHERQDRRIDESPYTQSHGERDEPPEGDTERGTGSTHLVARLVGEAADYRSSPMLSSPGRAHSAPNSSLVP